MICFYVDFLLSAYAVCAAPGSKTFQLLEIVHQSTGPGSLPDGLVLFLTLLFELSYSTLLFLSYFDHVVFEIL